MGTRVFQAVVILHDAGYLRIALHLGPSLILLLLCHIEILLEALPGQGQLLDF